MKRSLLDWLFPPKCPFCRRLLSGGQPCPCESSLPHTGENALREGEDFGRCAAPLWYEGGARDSLLRFKFQGERGYAAGYGDLLASCAADCFSGDFDCVSWVPVSDKRRRERGYDQAELLAIETAKRWDTKPVALLRKIGDNPAQSGLPDAAARRKNVRGMYAPLPDAALPGRRVLLIDDILTTGSTLGECVRVLRAAGAASVCCLTLAQTREKAGAAKEPQPHPAPDWQGGNPTAK
ncbi:MAG: ComF family protein [Oscillospiraceae bacterium]